MMSERTKWAGKPAEPLVQSRWRVSQDVSAAPDYSAKSKPATHASPFRHLKVTECLLQ